jgi:DNA replicative helicase MCM subunit Mcm2 (Cdc46/Mcm family)
MVRKDDDNYMLSIGPAAQARGAICAVNEGGWLKFTDQSQLLDIMEEGFFTINKHGFNARIRADTSILLSANPKFHTQFSDNSGDSKVDLDEVPLLKTIIDRLDLILIFKPEANEQGIRDYIDQKAEQEDKPIRNYDNFLRKLMLYCRSLNPVVDEKAKSILKESYVRMSIQIKQNNLAFGSHRLADTLFRVTRAIARLKLKKVADATDARQAIEFYNSMIMQTIGVIVIPEEPQDVAVKVMLDIFKDKAKLNDISLRELADFMSAERTGEELPSRKP